MNTAKPKTKRYQPTPGEIAWARSAIKDLLTVCVLNVKLKGSGFCQKYLFEMSDLEMKVYEEQVQELRAIHVHQLPALPDKL